MSDRSTDVKLKNSLGVSIDPATESTLQSVLTAISGVATDGYPDTIVHGSKTVTTAGTRVQLLPSTNKKGFVYIKTKSSNVGFIYTGGSTVDNTSIAISSGKYVPIPLVDDLSKVWIDSSEDGEGVDYTAYYIN